MHDARFSLQVSTRVHCTLHEDSSTDQMTPKQLDTLDFRQFHWRFSTDVLVDSTAVPPEQTQLARSTRLHQPPSQNRMPTIRAATRCTVSEL